MKIKYIFIAALMLAILMGGAVSATDTLSEDIISDSDDVSLEITDTDIYTTEESSFADLTGEIQGKEVLDLNQDYTFNNQTDDSNGIIIDRDNFVLNGNGHTIDGNNQSRIFQIRANNVTLSNLILTSGNSPAGSAVFSIGTVTLNNITFIDNYATSQAGAVFFNANASININNSRFIDNYGPQGSSIFVVLGTLNLYNSEFTSSLYAKRGQIILYMGAAGHVENVTFSDIFCDYSPAIHLESSNALTLISSRFINLKGNISSGAVSVKGGSEIYIRNCEFINVTSSKNAGAVLADIGGGSHSRPGNVTIIDTVFRDTYSGFGGAYMQLAGKLFISNTEFINSHAAFNGGAVYISYVDYAKFEGCNFTSNGVELNDVGYPTYGGAIFCDNSTLNINNSTFFNNTAGAGNAIYAFDTAYFIGNSTFENNTNPIYTVFDKACILENNVYINDDNVSTNNTYYAIYQNTIGLNLTLINNSINVDTLPSRFDLRDWGWVSPVRNQGWMGACWAFGMTGALESALLKATGIQADLSENNMQNTMLRYSIYGYNGAYEAGSNELSIAYLLSWLGAFIQDADTYDELGKISPLVTTNRDIHIQDIMFTPKNEISNGTQLKKAIMKYGSIDVMYNGQSTFDEMTRYYNPETYAQYVNDSSIQPNHAVTIVGWDDSFPKEKFLITPDGDGAWIVKNSWGPDWGDNGYLYLSYYDKTLLNSNNSGYAISVLIDNTVPYNKNYQYDIFWDGYFISGNGTLSYCNIFDAFDDDLIAAVGTFFNQSGVNYTVEVYVNDALKLTQNGVSPYYGYHTIKLNKYIPVKNGDVFKVVITSNAMPKFNLNESRTHYVENLSFISFDGKTWEDCYELGYIACLKAYTVGDDSIIINNNDIAVDYAGGKYFSVKVVTADNISVGAGAVVKFTINGKTTAVKTNSNGIAKIKITDVPKKYTIKTVCNGKTYTNKVTVKQVLTTSKVTVKKTAKKFTLQAKLKINGKLVKGKKVTFKLNGKTYKAKTNSKGIAKVTLKKNVIKKLKKGKKYTVKVTYLKDTIKTTVNVK